MWRMVPLMRVVVVAAVLVLGACSRSSTEDRRATPLQAAETKVAAQIDAAPVPVTARAPLTIVAVDPVPLPPSVSDVEPETARVLRC